MTGIWKADFLQEAKYFFDTYAIFEILNNNQNYKKYSSEPIVTSLLNLGELYYGLLREENEKIAIEWKNKLEDCYIGFDPTIIVKSMKFKHENKNKKMSFIDCVGYIIAKENGLKFLTGDEQFKGMPNVEFVK